MGQNSESSKREKIVEESGESGGKSIVKVVRESD